MADKQTTISRPQQIPGWFGPGLIAAAAAIMLFVSWRKWPDLLIDFGQQLYLAWQMSEGRTLYEELICNYGPLAPYANAWAFEWFGASVMTLVGLNLGVFLGIGIYSATRKRETAEDYLVASRDIKPWMAALSAVATNNSGSCSSASSARPSSWASRRCG